MKIGKIRTKIYAVICGICALVFSLVAVSCGAIESTSSKSGEEIFAELNTYSVSLAVGETYSLEVSENKGDPVWSSLNENVATVSDGTITAVGAGTTTIVCDVDGFKLQCSLNVSDAMLAGVHFYINKEVTSIYVGFTKQLTPKLMQGAEELDAVGYNLHYESDDTDVATVNSDGVLTGVAVGETTIHASVVVDGTTYTSSTSVAIKSLSTIAFAQKELKIAKAGDHHTATATATLYDVVAGDLVPKADALTWTTKDNSVATVDSDGVVTGLKVGTTEVVASCKGVSASIPVKVFNSYSVIYTPNDFQNIDKDLNGYYELANDIDFDGLSYTPIAYDYYADNSVQFMGEINGNGYSVKNITHTTQDTRSIVSALGSTGAIYDIAFENVRFTARVARSAGVCWWNRGRIENVKISLTTSGTGSAVNEWGFASIVSANGDTGNVHHCLVDIVDLSDSSFTGAIFNVNKGGTIYNNVALVHKDGLKAFTHTGSYVNVGSIMKNNEIVKTVDDATSLANKYLFDTEEMWTMDRLTLPALKNAGKTIQVLKETESLLSEASDLQFVANASKVYYYNNNEKTDIAFTKDGTNCTIKKENLPLKAGVNTLYVVDGENVACLKVLAVTKYISDVNGLLSIKDDMNGYYVLSQNIDAWNGSNRRFNYPIGLDTSAQTTEKNPFNGTLDGRGYSIKYEYSWVSDLGNHTRGLFHVIGASGTVKNLSLDVATDTYNGVRRSAIAWSNRGKIENCYVHIVYNNIGQATDQNNSACGFVCANYGTIRGCVVSVKYTGANAIDNKLYGLCAKNNGLVANTAVIKVVDNGSVGTLNTLNSGISSGYTDNLLEVSSKSAFTSGLSSFIAHGFDPSGVWAYNSGALTFGGTEIS